jgi:hypothetical protein
MMMMMTHPRDDSKVTAFSFCPTSGGSIFYSSTTIDSYWVGSFCPSFTALCNFHANAMYAFIYDIDCSIPPTCPPSPVISASWLPPNGKMTRLSLSAVPTFDPTNPGTVSITNVTYYDSPQGRKLNTPLASWSPASGAATAEVGSSLEANSYQLQIHSL